MTPRRRRSLSSATASAFIASRAGLRENTPAIEVPSRSRGVRCAATSSGANASVAFTSLVQMSV
jgi:hypothetical protein